MKVIVIGAGVVGLTSAYYLHQRGAQVTVIDQSKSVATGASFGNGGQLSYGYVDPLASPSLLKQFFRIASRRDMGVKVSLSKDPDYYRWLQSFLRQCNWSSFNKTSRELLQMSLDSRARMVELTDLFGCSIEHRVAGKFVLIDKPSTQLANLVQTKSQHGLKQSLVSKHDAIALENQLADFALDWSHAVYSPQDAVGDAQRFCEVIAHQLVRCGVQWQPDHQVEAISLDKGRATGVIIDGQILDADAVAVCAGMGSTKLLRTAGLKCDLMPVGGYSLTASDPNCELHASVTVPSKRIVFSRLGDALRIAGFADIGRTCANHSRYQDLTDEARRLAPHLTKTVSSSSSPWYGIRATTADSLPRVGATEHKGLFTNIGHGMFGWTLAAGTGHALAQQIINN